MAQAYLPGQPAEPLLRPPARLPAAAELTPHPAGRPLDARAVLALQRLAGNAAVAHALSPVVQRAKKKKTTKKIRRADLGKRLRVAMKSAQTTKVHNKLLKLYEIVKDEESTAAELRAAITQFHVLVAAHHAALGQVASHPAGAHVADHAGNLKAPYYGNVRGSFYPSSYSATAKMHRNTWVAANPGVTPGTIRCPGYGLQPAHDVAKITIDHISSVCAHWNTGGNNMTGAARGLWYSDHNNHVYLCGPCNTAKGSGGNYYTQSVGMNFRV